MRSIHRLSDVGSSDLASSLEQLLFEYTTMIKRQILDELGSAIPNIENVLSASPQLLNLLSPRNFCADFNTVYKQERYFIKNFRLVEPVAVKLGGKWLRRKLKNYRITAVNSYGYYVPFFDSLSALLRLPEVAQEIMNKQPLADDCMRDFCDGQFCTNHQILADSKALKIISYHDEFNVANPLGPHARPHKLTVFYYSLGNIRPEFRSKISVIQLLAIARSEDVKKFGNSLSLLLGDFINSLNVLRNGVDFHVGTSKIRLTGALACHIADTPASQQIGKFIEGVGTALKPCR